MVEKRRSPSPPSAAQDATHDNDSSNAERQTKRLHLDTSDNSSNQSLDSSNAVPTLDAALHTVAWSQESTVEMTEDTSSSDVSMLASTQEIAMEQCSADDSTAIEVDAVPQTPPPVTRTRSAVHSPSSARISSSNSDSIHTSNGPNMQLDPSGSTKMLHAARSIGSSNSETAAASPACLSLTIHAQLPALSDEPLARIAVPPQRDVNGTLWRIVWCPHGERISDSDAAAASLYVERLIDHDDAPAVPEQPQAMRLVLTLERHAPHTEPPYEQSCVHLFTSDSCVGGSEQFISRSALLQPTNAFVDADGLVRVVVHLESITQAFVEQPSNSPLLLDDVDALDASRPYAAPSSIPFDARAATGMVGLKNQGATCYMNSLLQTLYHLRAFRHVVYATPTALEDTHESVSLALQRVFYRLQTQQRAVSTKELTRSFGWSQIDSFMQHDVQELYRILCDRLEEKMKHTAVDAGIRKLFEGRVRSFVQCVDVAFESSREESFYDLQLDVRGCRDIYASFRKYVSLELLEGENQYDAGAHGKQDAQKGVAFVQLPPVLNIQLKRFEYDGVRDQMVKIHDRFAFPKTLVLDEFLEVASSKEPVHVYHLHSVLVHSGDVHGGHYFVFIRPKRDVASSDAWFRFDDDQITAVDEATAIDGNFGTGSFLDDEHDEPSRLQSPVFQSVERSNSLETTFASSSDVVPDDDVITTPAATDPYDYTPLEASTTTSLLLPLESNSQNNHRQSFSSAYMLVYVRDGNNDIQSIATADASDDDVIKPSPADDNEPVLTNDEDRETVCIPPSLVERFEAEEQAHLIRKQQQQTEHLFMTVRIASDSSVSNLQRITKTMDFSSFTNAACVRLRIERSASVTELCRRIFHATGVPMHRQRLWKVITRENRTQRPDVVVNPHEIDCLERLMDDDASPKAPVKLFLQIVDDEDEAAEEEEKEDETIAMQRKCVIYRHLWDEFTPPESPSDNDNETATDDALALAPVRSPPPPLKPFDILLFLKSYDVSKPLNDRLEYKGNLLIDARATGAALAAYIQQALRLHQSLVLFEAIQPHHVSRIDMEMQLDAAEIQHGDIICYQFATGDSLDACESDEEAQDEGDDDDEAEGETPIERRPQTQQEELYPTVPLYFQYLLDRVEVVFRRHPHSILPLNDPDSADVETETDDDGTFSLHLLLSHVYDDIIDAVATHVFGLVEPEDHKRLFVRLFQHSPMTNQPKKHPLRHAKYAGNDRVTLDEFLTEFTERTNVLYYEVLSHSITEVEAKRQVVVFCSVHAPQPQEPSAFIDAAAPHHAQRVEFLVAPTARVSDLMTQIAVAFNVADETHLRLSAVSHDGTRLLSSILARDTPLDRFSTPSGYASSTEHALFVEQVPADELALRDKDEDDDDNDSDSDDPLVQLGVVHFHFQTNTHVYIQTFGVPLVVSFRLSETLGVVKERIRQRLNVSTDEFRTWRFAAVKDLRASLVAEAYGDLDAQALEALPLVRLEEWCGTRLSDITSFGLEHADPTPLIAAKAAGTRRQDHGIRIRQN